MSTNRPEVIGSENLSVAWAKAFLLLYGQASHKNAPLVISVTDFANELPVENIAIRSALDLALLEAKRFVVKKTALTIFPNDLWELRNRPEHAKFAPLFRKRWFPAVHQASKHNQRGTYFQRMVAHGAAIQNHHLLEPFTDQLAKIISFWGSSHRRSALQAAIFDPSKDHNGSALSPFPCLQQVSFSFDQSGGLAVTGYYPSEYIFERGYGNYLGLSHLGRYMAQQLKLKLVRMNCVVAHPILTGDGKKGPLAGLQKAIAGEIERLENNPHQS